MHIIEEWPVVSNNVLKVSSKGKKTQLVFGISYSPQCFNFKVLMGDSLINICITLLKRKLFSLLVLYPWLPGCSDYRPATSQFYNQQVDI